MSAICPYCSKPAVLVTGKDIYPHRPDLFEKHFYRCRPCGAQVGCHPGTTTPLGRLANAELREWKQRAHAAFDPIWQSGNKKRRDAYHWLSQALGISFADTHIGMFDVPTCQRVVGLCQAFAFEKSKELPAYAPPPELRRPARYAELLKPIKPIKGADYKPLCNCQPPWQHCEHTVIAGMMPAKPQRKAA